jgi:hypothetical protein
LRRNEGELENMEEITGMREGREEVEMRKGEKKEWKEEEEQKWKAERRIRRDESGNGEREGVEKYRMYEKVNPSDFI